MSKTASLARVAAAYLVAIGVGLAWLLLGPEMGRLWLDVLIADVLATLVVFVASRVHGNSSFVDPYWSVVPPLIALYWWVAADRPGDARWWLLLVVMLLWAIRLTANWVRGFEGLHHEDWRYPLIRERAGRLGLVADLVGVHLVPTLQVFLGLVPVYVVITRAGEPFGWLDVVALLVGLGAVTLEEVADRQMHRFLADRKPREVMDRGVWSWSRHPNYVGECGVWLSFGLFALAASPGSWWVLVGVVGMVVMFQAASIPMMERRSLERRPGYADVVRRVPRFLPRPPLRE